MAYTKRRRERRGKCNICGKVYDLTYDHVPPKFWYNSEKIEYKEVFCDAMDTEKKFEISQNGIKFRSICSDCNNRILGRNYDIELKKWIEDIKKYMLSDSINNSEKIVCEVKVNKIARAIAGHLLAAKNIYEEENKIDIELREFVLDESKSSPHNMLLLFRPYIFSTILLIRDIVVTRVLAKKPPLPKGVISCLSSFPLAFVLVKDGDEKCGLDDLFSFCTNNIEESVKLPVNMNSLYFEGTDILRPMLWPCNVSDGFNGTDFILYGEAEKDSTISFRTNEQFKKYIMK